MKEKLCINGHSWIQPEECPNCGEESIYEYYSTSRIILQIYKTGLDRQKDFGLTRMFSYECIKRINDTDYDIEFSNGSIIHFRSEDKLDQIRGLEVDLVYYDEFRVKNE